jgi:hypothetical protein
MSTSSIGEGVSTSADVKPPIPEPIQSAAGGDKKKKCCKLHVMWLYPINVIRGFSTIVCVRNQPRTCDRYLLRSLPERGME